MAGLNIYTRNIYLLGSAEKGPVNYPVQITDINRAKRIFGSVGSLIDGASQIIDMQVPCNLWLVKTTGRHGEINLNVMLESGDIIKNGFVIRSRHADDVCNNIELLFDDNIMTFKLTGYRCKEITYELKNYSTVKELADAINNDTRLMKNEVVCVVNCPYDTILQHSLTPVNKSFHKMTGGDNGLIYTKSELFFSLMNTYSTLEGQFTDIIIPLHAYYDDTYTEDEHNVPFLECNKDYLMVKNNITGTYDSFYRQLISFCVQQMQHGFITHGVMDTSPRSRFKLNEEDIPGFLAGIKRINKLDYELQRYDMMVSVCFTDLWDNYGTHITSGAVPYASLIASTNVMSSTTNLNLSNKFLVVDKYSNYTLSTIASYGFVGFRYSPLHHLTVVNQGVTLCSDSNFKFIENVRTFQIIAKHFRTFLYKYVGMNIEDLVVSGVFEDEITIMLELLKTNGLIHSVQAVSVTIDDYQTVIIDLDIISIHTLSSIKMTNGVCLGRGGV